MTAITLPARCDRAAACALLPELMAAQGTAEIRVDGSQVEQIGQAMLQLLVSARRTAGGATILPSPALAEACRMTGLSAELFDEVQS
ncbi:STAS domain-containing protein [Novosphingobium lentum]|uniref:STAS domain-containing protein n=1 Tax=Novosphingobium lentum TaxID=145287 RepID=UPI00082BF0D0|nr:STAS domain-containing protein [Novosphingobium lentum]